MNRAHDDMTRPVAAAAAILLATVLTPPATAADPASTAGLTDKQRAARDDWPADTRLLAPELPEAPEIDGRVGETAWDTAAGFEVTLNPEKGNVFPRLITWRLAWRDGTLYVAARTPILEGEDLVTGVDPGDGDGAPDLTRADSYEVWIAPPAGDKVYRAAVAAGGMKRLSAHARADPANGEKWGVNAKIDATVKEDFFDAEFALPFAPMGAEPEVGQAWRFMFVRNFRVGVKMRSFSPVGDPDDPAKFARMVISETGPGVLLKMPAHELYEQKARFAGRVRPLPEKPLKLTADAAITASEPESVEHYNRQWELQLDPAGAFEVTGWTRPRVEKYSPIDHAYRYALTLRDADGDEVYHIHFPINTTENRPWVATTIPGFGAGKSKQVLVDPDGPYPDRWRGIMRRYQDLPEGHKVRVTAKRIFDPSNRVHFDAPQNAVAVNPEGAKDGAEHQLNHWATQVLKTIHWENGVKHGPEKHWASANRKRYARTVIPWKNGKVEGVKRTFFPNGQTMVEVRYDDGKPVGKATTYDRQGRVLRTTEYKGGVRHGERIDYFPPEVKRRIPLENGEINGLVREYNRQGRLIHETPFRHDVLHGVEKRYNDAGEVTDTRYWLNGEKVTEAEYRNR